MAPVLNRSAERSPFHNRRADRRLLSAIGFLIGASFPLSYEVMQAEGMEEYFINHAIEREKNNYTEYALNKKKLRIGDFYP